MVSRPVVEEPLPRPPVGGGGPQGPAADHRFSGQSPGGVEESVPGRARIIAPSLLLPAEIVIFELKPSLWYAALVSVPIAAVGLGLVVLTYAIKELPPPLRVWGVVIGVWVIGLRVAVALLQWLGRTYVLTDRRILTQAGVFDVHVECASLEEIENTFVAQAAAQRLLGIGTLFFRCGPARRDVMAWEHVRRPREVHAHVVAQIERWKRSRSLAKSV
jgi:hypothetical protein